MRIGGNNRDEWQCCRIKLLATMRVPRMIVHFASDVVTSKCEIDNSSSSFSFFFRPNARIESFFSFSFFFLIILEFRDETETRRMRTTDESRDGGRKFRNSGPTGGVACKFSCNWFLRGGGEGREKKSR